MRVTSNDHGSNPEAGPVTDRIFERFSEALLASKQFDEDAVRQLVALARGEALPKATQIEKLLQREEQFE